MRKIFLFLSVMLLFLGMTLANPPPVFDLGDDQTEFILSFDQPVDIQGDITAEIYHPTVFAVIYMTTTSEVVNIGYGWSVNDYNNIYKTTWNIDRLEIVGLSRLDIGEAYSQTF